MVQSNKPIPIPVSGSFPTYINLVDEGSERPDKRGPQIAHERNRSQRMHRADALVVLRPQRSHDEERGSALRVAGVLERRLSPWNRQQQAYKRRLNIN